MPDLSIVMVTYNPGEDVLDSLSNIFASVDISLEVIVVDNHSQDGTPERIQQHFPQVQVIVNSVNNGFAVATNMGLKASAGRYLLLLNPDVMVKPDTLKIMVDYLESHSNVGIAGPRSLNGEGKVVPSANDDYTPTAAFLQFWGIPYHIYRRKCAQATAPFDAAWVQGACLMFRRTIYEQIGGLDEGLFLFCEESDFCERASQRGWRTVYLPQAQITHFVSSTVSRYPLVKMRHHHISPLYYFRKRNRHRAVRVLKLGYIAELSAKHLVCLIKNRISPRDSLDAKIRAYPEVIKDIWTY